MKVLKDIQSITFDAGEGFRVDIVTVDGLWEAWLYHKNIGIKSLMFGQEVGANDVKDLNSFARMVDANLDVYIENYENEYFD